MSKYLISFNVSGEVIRIYRCGSSPAEAYQHAVKATAVMYELDRNTIRNADYEIKEVK